MGSIMSNTSGATTVKSKKVNPSATESSQRRKGSAGVVALGEKRTSKANETTK